MPKNPSCLATRNSLVLLKLSGANFNPAKKLHHIKCLPRSESSALEMVRLGNGLVRSKINLASRM